MRRGNLTFSLMLLIQPRNGKCEQESTQEEEDNAGTEGNALGIGGHGCLLQRIGLKKCEQ